MLGSHGVRTESDYRFYTRRAAEERQAAQRSVTDQARAWHEHLACEFAARALETQPLSA